jgi:PTS system mannose-specific IIA component
MIGLVLVTHGRLAAEFITAMEHVVGPQQAIEGICIDADDDMEMRRQDIAGAIQRCDQGQGVIILTDLFGGTPSNLAMTVRAAVAAAREAGRKYISVASEILGEAAA